MKRYLITTCSWECDSYMREDRDGKYIKHSDATELEAENRRLSACDRLASREIEQLKAENERLIEEALYRAGGPCAACERLKAENEKRIHIIAELNSSLAESNAENERLKNKLQVLKDCHIVILDAYQVSTQRQFALKAENERLKKQIDYLEGYIKMLKDNEVSDVIGEVL